VPNNWISMFNGPSWELDPASGQYYLHTFLPEQPDLNWRNPQVRAAMFDNARFWLDRGVDGFRIDVAQMVMKDPQLRDNPPNPSSEEFARLGEWSKQLHLHDIGHPDLHELYRDWRRMLDEYGARTGRERTSIGELHHPEFEQWAHFYGEAQDEIHVPFNFHLLHAPWTSAGVRRAIEGVEGVLPDGAFASWVLGNHDQSRVASRLGRDQARAAMLLLLTLRGTPTIYYGEEIGMLDVPVPHEQARDPWERREPGKGRDGERSPMQWDASPNAGFSAPDATPWLPLAPDAQQVNVAAQAEDPASMLSLTRRLIAMRRDHPVLAGGDFAAFGPTPEGTYAFRRVAPDAAVTVVLNLTDAPMTIPRVGSGRVLIGTHRSREGETVDGALALSPNEALVIEEA
jgi:glycosidase